MSVKVMWGSCHRESCSPGNRVCFINSTSVKPETSQALKWTLSQGNRERSCCLREQKSARDNGASVHMGKGWAVLSALNSYFQWGTKFPCWDGGRKADKQGDPRGLNSTSSPPRFWHVLSVGTCDTSFPRRLFLWKAAMDTSAFFMLTCWCRKGWELKAVAAVCTREGRE